MTQSTKTLEQVLPWVVAIAFFMQSVDATILNTALPSIAKDLQESPFHMQSAIVSYTLTVAIIIPLNGYLADRVGTRTLFLFAVIFFSFGSLLCALSPDLNALVCSRIIQGIGGALMVPVARLALIKSIDRHKFLNAMNFAAIPGMIGPVVGPLLGGYLSDIASWHWIFIINLPIGLIGIFCGLKFMPNLKQQKRSRFDLCGYGLFVFAVVMLSLSLEFISEDRGLLFSSIIFICGCVALYSYFMYSKQSVDVLFPKSLFSIKTFSVGLLGNLISRMGMSAIPLLIPLLLQLLFGYSASESGWMLMPMALASLLMKTGVTRIIRKYGYRNILIVNTVFVSVIIMSLALFTFNLPIVVLAILLMIIGFANSLQYTSMNTITLADLYDDLTSSGNTLLSVVQQLSVSLGIAAGASLLRIFEAPNLFDLSVYVAFRYSFIVLGMITLFSSLLFARLSVLDGSNLFENSVDKP